MDAHSVAGQREYLPRLHSKAELHDLIMSAFTLSKISAAQARGAYYNQAKRRWLHGSLKRQATIMMPAMSPLMTEGTITRWKKKEGEAFAAGDVLLQIESDIATIDVEACNPGILGKILTPEGTSNVPIEQVIALVARDMDEFVLLQNQSIASSFPSPLKSTPCSSAIPPSSPQSLDSFKPLLSPRTPTMSRTPSLFEMHTMGYGYRSAHVGGPRGTLPRLDYVGQASRSIDIPPCPSPRIPIQPEVSASPISSNAHWPRSATEAYEDECQAQVNGAAIRRMIVSNLARSKDSEGVELDVLV